MPFTSPANTTPSGTDVGASEPSAFSTRSVLNEAHSPLSFLNRTGAANCSVVTDPSAFTHVLEDSDRSAVTSTRLPVARAWITADGKSTTPPEVGAACSTGEGEGGGVVSAQACDAGTKPTDTNAADTPYAVNKTARRNTRLLDQPPTRESSTHLQHHCCSRNAPKRESEKLYCHVKGARSGLKPLTVE
ncbi:hypothetical protein ACUXOQ_000645 [Dermabacter hominis]